MNNSAGRGRLRPYLLSTGILALALAVLLAAAGCGSSPDLSSATVLPTAAAGPAPQTGQPAPDFTLQDLSGNTVRLSDFRGKAVYINFWASWCPPCRAEMPDIEALYRKYQSSGAVILGVDLQETRDTVQKFVQQNGYGWTFLLDTTGEVAMKYNVLSIPTSIFVDKAGIIRQMNVGEMTQQQMEPMMSGAMK